MKMTKDKIKEKVKKEESFLELLLYIFVYIIDFIILEAIFKNVEVSSNYKYLICIAIVMLIYIINKTIKPILVKLTIPITGVTLGLFYPFINLFILYCVSWIFGDLFILHNFWFALLFSICYSLMNILMHIILDSIMKRVHSE